MRKYDRIQMSPALSVLILVVGICAIVYVYRRIIIDTLLTMLLAIGLLAAVIFSLAFIASSIRWYRRRRKLAAGTQPMPVLGESDRDEMAKDADWLAGSGVELAFSPDGSSLVVRKPPEPSPETEPETPA